MRHLGQDPIGGMDQSRVPAMWFDKSNNTRSGHAHLSMRVRRSHQCYDVRKTPRLACPRKPSVLGTSETVLKQHTEQAVRPMARPVRFEWETTTGRSYYALPRQKVPKNSPQTRVPSTVTRMLLPGNLGSAGTPAEETAPSSGIARLPEGRCPLCSQE